MTTGVRARAAHQESIRWPAAKQHVQTVQLAGTLALVGVGATLALLDISLESVGVDVILVLLGTTLALVGADATRVLLENTIQT